MKKSVYLIIITIITVICILIGSLNFFVDWDDNLFYIKTGNDKHKDTLKPFQSIKIDGNIFGVYIESGNDYSIRYDCSKDFEPIYEVNNDVLTVTQKNVKTLQLKNKKSKLYITIPPKTKLSDLELKLDVGDVEICDLEFDDINIAANVGEIVLSEITANTLTLEANTGDISLEDTIFTNSVITCDIGDVDIMDGEFLQGYTIDASSSIGEVEAGDDYDGRLFHQDGTKGSLSVTTNVGDIDIEIE